mmetsp:Transcript_2266/g.5995  ORF Transcript_2266/g.5995 Transcript_2266/m.5995 type:complete len:424 (-) Transcript_2266:397-1668(-)
MRGAASSVLEVHAKAPHAATKVASVRLRSAAGGRPPSTPVAVQWQMPAQVAAAYAFCVPASVRAGLAVVAHGLRWVSSTLQLLVYVVLLLPGFLQMVSYYCMSASVSKHIPYGSGPRQQLDLYLPPAAAAESEDPCAEKRPVVVFITGGAWTIGYKAWGALLARRLSECGVLVACLDYRNFPQGSPAQMLEDVNTGISWVVRNAHCYGGDTSRITVVGQSAGAHLGALALFRQCEREAGVGSGGVGCPLPDRCGAELGALPAWSPRDVHAFVGISGVYDLAAIAEHMHRRGFGQGAVERIFRIDGEPALAELSPLERAKRWPRHIARRLPSMTLVHGTADNSAPHEGSCQLHDTLCALGVPSELQLVDGKGHTAFLLEGPMKGGPDLLSDAILRVVKGSHKTHVYPFLNPAFMCDLAERVCPF